MQPWQVVNSHGFLFDFNSFFKYLLFLLDNHICQILLHNLRIFLRLTAPCEILKCVLNGDYQFWETYVLYDLLNEDRKGLERVTDDFFFGDVAEKVGVLIRNFLIGGAAGILRGYRSVSDFGEICLIGNRERWDHKLTYRNENITTVFAQKANQIIQMQMKWMIFQMARYLNRIKNQLNYRISYWLLLFYWPWNSQIAP